MTMPGGAAEFEKITFVVLTRMNEYLPEGQKILCDSQTKLFGDEGELDSLGTINFIVAMEEEIENTLGKSISLSDEDLSALFEDGSVTVRLFSEYVATRLKG